MSTTVKMAVAALVGAALTAGAFLVFGQPRPGNQDLEIAIADDPVRDANGSSEAGPRLKGSESSEPGARLKGQDRTPESLAGLKPSKEELAFLRTALKDERARKAAAVVRPGDSGLDILTRVFEKGMDPWPLMKDASAFQAHVEPSPDRPMRVDTSVGETRDVDLSKLGSKLIEFGPGTFNVSVRRFRTREPISHLEIRGAGMDETTLQFDGELMVMAALENLRMSDLTLDYQNGNELLDVRDRAAAAFENVRFQDWSGGGYGAVIGVAGHAYLSCRNCEFVDSDGRGGQFAINFRGPALAVLERCAFIGLRSAIMATGEGKGSRVRLVACTFEETALTDTRMLNKEKQPTAEIRVEGARATFGRPDWSQEERHRHWGVPLAAAVSDIILEPTIRRLTIDDLMRVLRALDVPRGQVLFSIKLSAWSDEGPAAFQASTHTEGATRPQVYTVHRPDGRWTMRHEPRGGGFGYSVWPDLPPPMEMLAALEKSGIAPDTPASGVLLQRYGLDGQPKEKRLNFYSVGSVTGGTLIDASTGEALTWDELRKR